MSDVTTNKKLTNVGGLNDNSVIAQVLVAAKMVREFVCFICTFEQSFATSVQSVRFCRWLKMEKHERIAEESASLPFRCTLHFVLVKGAASRVMYVFAILVSGTLPR